MIQVRTVYQVKFGKMDRAIALFARLPGLLPPEVVDSAHYHLLSDVSGPMYTLVEEVVVPSLTEWESGRDHLFHHPGYAAWFKEFQLIVEGGQHEFYTLEGPGEDWSRPGVIVVRQAYRALKWQIRSAVELLQRYGALLTAFGVGRHPRILTDISGPMFQAVIEVETDGLTEWNEQRRGLFREADFQVWFVQLCSHVEAGSHSFYRVEK
jgi:hypothetical protein